MRVFASKYSCLVEENIHTFKASSCKDVLFSFSGCFSFLYIFSVLVLLCHKILQLLFPLQILLPVYTNTILHTKISLHYKKEILFFSPYITSHQVYTLSQTL